MGGAFKPFVVLQFDAEAPESLGEEGDLMLFEWGLQRGPSDAQGGFFVDLVRQFTVVAADGEYERMEQMRCSMSFHPTPELHQLGSGTIWSDGDTQRWTAEVEGSACFAALQTASACDIRIDHSRV